ncbi:MAG: hypothetical protein K0R50_4859, partial [Eubacterium sp.]|nr:hypothetical protein [Eubacterium sp.]
GGNSGGSSSSTGQSNQSTTAGKTDIVVNGQTQTGMANVQVKTEANGQKVTVVTVNSEKMLEVIAKSGEKAPEIIIPINGQTGTFKSELRGDVVKGLIEKKALVRIKTESAQYSLPASELNIQKAMEKLGAGKAKPEDIKLNLNIIAPDNSKADTIAKAAQKYGFQALGSPVTFKAEFVYNNQSFPVNLSWTTGKLQQLLKLPRMEPSDRYPQRLYPGMENTMLRSTVQQTVHMYLSPI